MSDKTGTRYAGDFDSPDGGPAMPCEDINTADRMLHYGMTLRDWFAGQALSGLVGNPSLDQTYEADALQAYSAADAMLAERAK